MRAACGKFGLVLVAVLLVSACGNEPRLMAHSSSDGPNEFTVIPGKQLESPKNYTELPAPTPGGTNLADLTPFDDAVSALGGNPAAAHRSSVPAADGALVAHASRNGVSANVRQELAAEDLEFRKTHRGRIMLRLAGRDRYFVAYSDQTLDQYRELERLQAAGVRTPSAPPRQPE